MRDVNERLESRCRQTLELVKDRLKQDMNKNGFWEGRLSSSPLSTAVALTALALADREAHAQQIRNGLDWLSRNINGDGGWGDSPGSQSNLSTTLLCWSALALAQNPEPYQHTVESAEAWLMERVGSLEPQAISRAVLSYYGNDRTFSAPILVMCALCGRLGEATQCWQYVPQLPLELAALPHGLFKWVRLPVVSYAIPALIAIGLVKHNHAPSPFPTRFLRNALKGKLLGILEKIQPDNGGYLEAAPLTGFVVMSLASSGFRHHNITDRGISFLLTSQREDGSWPIDTDLATWVTTLAVNALSGSESYNVSLPSQSREVLMEWLLSQQFTEEHVFTHAAPGGWSWTHLPGAVPDADDTAGALLTLRNLGRPDTRTTRAAWEGIRWLQDLQNRDGGIPTFCKGWGKLPFDRSCPDITAHALRALAVWQSEFDGGREKSIHRFINKGIDYLGNIQQADGSWLPLWFGNQWREGKKNPLYGTAQVIVALKHPDLRWLPGVEKLLQKGTLWLQAAQNNDGGWGRDSRGNSTCEETALALNALAGCTTVESLSRGILWLVDHIDGNPRMPATPIGLYFANLWYSETLYPVVFAASALKELLNTITTNTRRVTGGPGGAAPWPAGQAPRRAAGGIKQK